MFYLRKTQKADTVEIVIDDMISFGEVHLRRAVLMITDVYERPFINYRYSTVRIKRNFDMSKAEMYRDFVDNVRAINWEQLIGWD